jgi:hypothetical protein
MRATNRLDYRLRRIYNYYLESLTCEQTALAFAADWPAIARVTATVIRRVGAPLCFKARRPYGPLDDSPFAVASLDETRGVVSFRAATADELAGCRAASAYDRCGRQLGG